MVNFLVMLSWMVPGILGDLNNLWLNNFPEDKTEELYFNQQGIQYYN